MLPIAVRQSRYSKPHVLHMNRAIVLLAVILVPATASAQGSPSPPRVELGFGVAFIGVGAFDVSDFHADIQPGTAGLLPSVGVNLSERFSIDGAVVVDRVESERVVTYEVSLVINR